MNEFNIHGINVPFSSSWNSVAVSVSGGADSAMLAYLVCTLAKPIPDSTVHVISHTRMWKTRPWQSYDSLRVFNWLVDNFPSITFKRHVNFIAPELEYGNIGPSIKDEYGKLVSGDNIEQRAFAEFVCKSEKVDAYYNGVTRNPRNVDFKGMTERDIEPSSGNIHLRAMQHMGFWALHPFRFIEKNQIMRLYSKLSITELKDITRSCEGEFEGLDYTTYVPGQDVPTCGECFWCKEREWAIEHSK
jgi:hypothetical protein